MPQKVTLGGVYGTQTECATEAELLAFANSIREAGGANVIEALLPSDPQRPKSCLIANALNFGCEVVPFRGEFEDGSGRWCMELPSNLTVEQRTALGKVKGVRLATDSDHNYMGYYLTLPKIIGNAAEAFDEGVRFQEYAKKA